MDSKDTQNLDLCNVNAEADHILEILGDLDPQSQEYGTAVSNLKVLQDIESSKEEVLLKKEEAKSLRTHRWVSTGVGALGFVLVSLAPGALKSFLDNRNLISPRELDDEEKENGKGARSFFSRMMGH